MVIKKNNYIAYVQSPFFKWCEKKIPYLPFIFKNKRQRVKCRWFFRYYHLRKINDILVNTLTSMQATPINYSKINVENLIPEYWEIVKE